MSCSHFRHSPSASVSSPWHQCVVLNLANTPDAKDMVSDPDWPEYWDHCLRKTTHDDQQWTREKYSADGLNCFSFVLAFLRSLRTSPFADAAADKVGFCRACVLPKTRLASKYIRLFRKIKTEGGVYSVANNKRSQEDVVSAAGSSTAEEDNWVSTEP